MWLEEEEKTQGKKKDRDKVQNRKMQKYLIAKVAKSNDSKKCVCFIPWLWFCNVSFYPFLLLLLLIESMIVLVVQCEIGGVLFEGGVHDLQYCVTS